MADVYNWAWVRDDNKVFLSKRQAVVDVTDPDFLALQTAGAVARWPENEAGAQTVASLQDVLTPYALWVDLVAYAASARWAKETGGIKVGSASIDTSRESQAMIANAYQFMTVSGATSAQYKSNTGWVAVSADQMKSIALAVGTHVQACFNAEQDLDEKIAAGTITTKAEIDAAFAAVSP